jgi:hypothetical protein
MLLALSTAGGPSGERLLPLMRADDDWDALGDLLPLLVPELAGPDLTRLFLSLAESRDALPSDPGGELDALIDYALRLIARRWNNERAVIAVGLLASWFELAARLAGSPAAPELARTWFELLPTDRIDLNSPSDLTRFDEWSALAELLSERAPDSLAAYGFPERHREVIGAFVEDVGALDGSAESPARRELLTRILWRLHALAPRQAGPADEIAARLALVPEERELPPTYHRRPISRELRKILDAPPVQRQSDAELVASVLRDL